MSPKKSKSPSPRRTRPACFTRHPSYPARGTDIPAGTSLTDICAQYPNHLAGQGLDRFFGIMKARSIYDHMPDAARSQSTSTANKANYIQKRLDNRRYQLIRDHKYNGVIRENFNRENMLLDQNELIDSDEEQKKMKEKVQKSSRAGTKQSKHLRGSGRHQRSLSGSPFESLGLCPELNTDEGDHEEGDHESDDEGDDENDSGDDDGEYRPRHHRRPSNQRLARVSPVADNETDSEDDGNVANVGTGRPSKKIVVRLRPAALRQALGLGGDDTVTAALEAQPRTPSRALSVASSQPPPASTSAAAAAATRPVLHDVQAHQDDSPRDPNAQHIERLRLHLPAGGTMGPGGPGRDDARIDPPVQFVNIRDVVLNPPQRE